MTNRLFRYFPTELSVIYDGLFVELNKEFVILNGQIRQKLTKHFVGQKINGLSVNINGLLF